MQICVLEDMFKFLTTIHAFYEGDLKLKVVCMDLGEMKRVKYP